MNDINKKRKIILQMQHMGMKVDPADLEEVERDYDAKYIKTFCEHIPNAMKQYIARFKHPVRICIDILPQEGMIRVGSGTVKDDHTTETLLPICQPKYKKVLQICTPDGEVWENRYSYLTFLHFIEAVGENNVEKLNLTTSYGLLITKANKDTSANYRQLTAKGWFVTTSIATAEKVHLVNEISRLLKLDYVAAVTKIPVDD